jgi:hypothetical protein
VRYILVSFFRGSMSQVLTSSPMAPCLCTFGYDAATGQSFADLGGPPGSVRNLSSAEALVRKETGCDAVGDDEMAVAARYGLVASERYFFSTSVFD